MRSEKEKMINGEMYLSADETLVNERINARRLTRMYNNTIETEIERRREILEEGRAIKQELDTYMTRMERIKQEKIKELKDLNIQQKYIKELERYKIK